MQKSTTPSVKCYEGVDGVKQALMNQTKGTGENLSILHENMQTNTDQAFFERWALACNKRGLTFRSIIDFNFVSTQILWYVGHSNERLLHWEARSIPSSKFAIPHSLIVYDDVVLHFDWRPDKLFAVEIRDADLAFYQRQFFELLWADAKPQKC